MLMLRVRAVLRREIGWWFDFGCEGALFDLDGGNWVVCVSAPEGCGRAFGETEPADFPLSELLFSGSGDLFFVGLFNTFF